MELKTQHSKILSFYKKYPSLKFEEVNLLFVDLFERILNNASGVVDNTTLTNLLHKIQQTAVNTENTLNQIENIKSIQQISNEKNNGKFDNINTILTQITKNISDNATNLKSELSNNIISHIGSNEVSQETINKINILLENNLNSYLDKTKLFYMEKLPNILDNNNKPLLQTLTASEERLTNSLSEIKEKSTINNENTNDIKQAVQEHIINTKTSARKGDISENKLLPILNEIFPTCQVIHNGGGKQSHCCDYTIIRNTTNILIENKDYNVNIGPDNIKKFIDDIEKNNCNGIFLSQQSGISGKDNYKIDIHKNNVLVYIHGVNYDIGKIRAAVEIIDQLSYRLNEIDMDENSISKDDLDTINIEFNNFIESKENIIKMVNEFQKRLILSVRQLNLSCLEKYLNNKFAHMKSFDFICEYCNKGWDTRRALASHQKSCKKIHNSIHVDTIEVDT